MLRAGLRALNALLVAASAYLLATGVRPLLSTAPVPEASLGAEAEGAAPSASGREPSFERYRAVASRDLFRGGPPSAGPPAPPPEEVIEESDLRYRLVGTAAAARDPHRSVAVVEDESSRQTVLVRPDHELSGARVVRIERKRIVVENKGQLQEIKFEENPGALPPPGSPAARAAPQKGARRTPNRVPAAMPAAPPAVTPAGLQQKVLELSAQASAAAEATAGQSQAVKRTQSILTQARIIPRYAEDGAMSGLEVSSIRPGSLLEAAGFENGDLVVAVNGAPLADPGEGLKVFRELATAERFVVSVERQGAVLELQYQAEAQ
jgi:type II secretion system protein C